MGHHAVGRAEVTKAALTPDCSHAVSWEPPAVQLQDTALQIPVPLPAVKRQMVILIPRAESNPFFPNELDKEDMQKKMNFLFCSRFVSAFTTHLTYFVPQIPYFLWRERVESSEISAHTH